MQETLSAAQYEQLLKDLNPSRVSMLDGMAYMEAWDIRAHLIRMFGFGGFSIELLDYELAYEQETTTRQGKAAFKVGYRARVQLTIHSLGATYTEAAFGESVMPDFKRGDAHDMAIKTAESQALKRAAVNLGTQFGLSLYRDGSTVDVVGRTLAQGPDSTPANSVKADRSDITSAASAAGIGASDLEKNIVSMFGPDAKLDALTDEQAERLAKAIAAKQGAA